MASDNASGSRRPIDSALFADFARYFELSLALSEGQRAAVYEVRYRVYCEEFGYEPKEAFLDGRERDAYDDQSLHCLVTHRESRRPAGCVRLVLPEEGDQLPLEEHCADALDPDFMGRFADQRAGICEISRLAVDGDFRRRRGEKATRFGTREDFSFAERERRTFPLIAISLFVASAAGADLYGRPHCFAIMEPFLPVMLRRTGVVFERIGDDFEFRGTRAPYYARVDDLVRNAPDELRMAFGLVRDQFARDLGLGGAAESRALTGARSAA
ncbi:MAG: PEP-CTERM/exosortase system-associated acyltransferase [Pseudohaliea sp.]